MGAPNISVHPSSAMDHFYQESVTNTKVEVSDTKTNMYGFLFENNDSSAVYVQIFNKDADDVTVGTTAPDFTYLVPANSVFGKDAQDIVIDHFNVGLTIAVTTTRTGAAAPTTAATIHIWHRN